MNNNTYKTMEGGEMMKKIILILVMVLICSLPVFAENYIQGKVTYNDSAPGIDSNYLELYLENKINDNLTSGITVDLNDIGIGMSLDVNFDLMYSEGHTIGIGTGADLVGMDLTYVKFKVLNYKLGDNMVFGAKARYNFAGNYWAVANIALDMDRIDIAIEGRVDSDGAEPYSFGTKLVYALSDDIDVEVGYEINGFDEAIGDWGNTIEDSNNTLYVKATVYF